MKISFKLATLTLVVAASGGVFAQVAPPPFSLTLSSSEKVIRVGSEARLEIVLKNTSIHEFSIATSNLKDRAESHYLIDVRDSKGRPVPDTEYAHTVWNLNSKPTTLFVFSEIVDTLKPGETMTDVAVITKLYDLTRPGKYTIRVSRKIWKELGKGTVKSNPITITVIK
jgi:hypothetical protein